MAEDSVYHKDLFIVPVVSVPLVAFPSWKDMDLYSFCSKSEKIHSKNITSGMLLMFVILSRSLTIYQENE
jgi:hypothetical protein